jgi:hypothetical protein
VTLTGIYRPEREKDRGERDAKPFYCFRKIYLAGFMTQRKLVGIGMNTEEQSLKEETSIVFDPKLRNN